MGSMEQLNSCVTKAYVSYLHAYFVDLLLIQSQRNRRCNNIQLSSSFVKLMQNRTQKHDEMALLIFSLLNAGEKGS